MFAFLMISIGMIIACCLDTVYDEMKSREIPQGFRTIAITLILAVVYLSCIVLEGVVWNG